MKVSFKWLNNYIDIEDYFEKPEELGQLLTFAGLELENIEDASATYKHVVVGHIVELGKHPDADKLTLCKVDVGSGELQQIICGASNHKQGDKVVVACPGAVLPGDFAIKKSKIRGVESLGMLCSEVELGLATESEGIQILASDAPIGQNFSEYAALNDVVVELGVTPNRADCLSHFGLARELSCLLDRPLKTPESSFKADGEPIQSRVKVTLKQDSECPRYAGRGIYGVKVGPSPQWLRQSLESVGLNSINNIVDVTNYVMFEYGQPLHAFDINFLEGSQITIDSAKAGESFTTLDETELKFEGDELTIRDSKKAVALAGVVGGLNSGVVDETCDLFIESAHFLPQVVRKSVRKFGVDTDSGYRFSRGTDPEIITTALDRACHLIQQVAGGKVSKDTYDHYPSPKVKPKITLSHETLVDRLGIDASLDKAEEWLVKLGCSVNNLKDKLEVISPAFRWDLEIEMDLVEEIGRLEGYDKIPEIFPQPVDWPTKHAEPYVKARQLNELMSGESFLQAVNYAFVSGEDQAELLGDLNNFKETGLKIPSQAVVIKNPLSQELGTMRVSLFTSLFKNFIHNYRQTHHVGRLFEQAQVFEKNEDFEEQSRLAGVAWGQEQGLWNKESDRPVVYDLKSSIENILKKLKITSYDWRELKSAPDFLHPGQCVSLFFQGKNIGYLGSLHPALMEQYKVRHDVAFFEINSELLMQGQPKKAKLTELSKFPMVERDLAFVMPESTKNSEVLKAFKKFGDKKIQSVEVFDVYRGKPLADDEKSVSFKLIYQSFEGTLTEKELNQMQEKLTQSLSEKLNLKLR